MPIARAARTASVSLVAAPRPPVSGAPTPDISPSSRLFAQTLSRVRSLPITVIAASAVKKPASKGKIKMSGAKKKPKKAKKKPAKKAPSGPVKEKKVYDLPGQKKDTPEEGESLRKFYSSLRKQIPESVMAEQWLMEHGLLPADEAAKAYKKFLIRKGRDPKKAGGSSGSKPSKPKPKPKPKPAVKKEHKSPLRRRRAGSSGRRSTTTTATRTFPWRLSNPTAAAAGSRSPRRSERGGWSRGKGTRATTNFVIGIR